MVLVNSSWLYNGAVKFAARPASGKIEPEFRYHSQPSTQHPLKAAYRTLLDIFRNPDHAVQQQNSLFWLGYNVIAGAGFIATALVEAAFQVSRSLLIGMRHVPSLSQVSSLTLPYFGIELLRHPSLLYPALGVPDTSGIVLLEFIAPSISFALQLLLTSTGQPLSSRLVHDIVQKHSVELFVAGAVDTLRDLVTQVWNLVGVGEDGEIDASQLISPAISPLVGWGVRYLHLLMTVVALPFSIYFTMWFQQRAGITPPSTPAPLSFSSIFLRCAALAIAETFLVRIVDFGLGACHTWLSLRFKRLPGSDQQPSSSSSSSNSSSSSHAANGSGNGPSP